MKYEVKKCESPENAPDRRTYAILLDGERVGVAYQRTVRGKQVWTYDGVGRLADLNTVCREYAATRAEAVEMFAKMRDWMLTMLDSGAGKAYGDFVRKHLG